MNQSILIGRLTRKPEIRYTQNQTPVGRFTLAVDRPPKEGTDAEADFIRIIVWGKAAVNCERYLDKGSQAAVLGRITTGSYKAKDGSTVYTTEVTAERVEFLSRGSRESQPERDIPSAFEAVEDTIPF